MIANNLSLDQGSLLLEAPSLKDWVFLLGEDHPIAVHSTPPRPTDVDYAPLEIHAFTDSLIVYRFDADHHEIPREVLLWLLRISRAA